MPNALLLAKQQWEAGDRPAGFRTLNDHLDARLGQPAFDSSSLLFRSALFDRYFLALTTMTGDDRLLRGDFGAVFAVLWELFPHQPVIDLLLVKDLAPRPSDIDAIVRALTLAAEKGLLGPDLAELPNGGRPVLALATIDAQDDSRWGELKPRLARDLAAAYARCPRDFWDRLARQEPDQVVARFLHELFVVHNHSIDIAAQRWTVMQAGFPDFARSVRRSFESVLGAGAPWRSDWGTELVQIDAGFPAVRDGRRWLETLAESLTTNDFTALHQAR